MFRRFFGRRREERNGIEWTLAPKVYEEDNVEMNCSGKIMLPSGCLVDLVYKHIDTPYAFRITANEGISYTHCGVLDFTAEEGTVVLPRWLHDQLALERDSTVIITYKKVPVGKFIKFLPHNMEFLEIERQKEKLEKALKRYQVLSKGDHVELLLDVDYGSMVFTVVETDPSVEGISIIDTDLEVDFLPPPGYEEKMKLEKSVIPYLDIIDNQHGIREVRMKTRGLFFNLKALKNKHRNE